MIEGQTIPLSCKLGDMSASKYVRAYVRDQDGSAVAAVDLSHAGEGEYSSKDFIMPAAVEFLTVSYIVYDDAAYSVESPTYQNGTDVFAYDINTETILEKLDSIISQLNAIQGASTGPDLTGRVSVDTTTLAGIIDQLTTLRGDIAAESPLAGSIETENLLTGVIEDDGITGEV